MTTHNALVLRTAFGTYMTGVTVVTTMDQAGEPLGFTANSFTSVSLDPPLLLVCPGKHLTSFNEFSNVSHFAVNILADSQQEIANIFAGKSAERFKKVQWTGDRFGSPLIKDCLASFSCSVHERHDSGDHMILVGRVEDFSSQTDTAGRGLGYSCTGYFSLGKEQQANAGVKSELTGVAGAIIEYEGNVLISAGAESLCIPCTTHKGLHGARGALAEYLFSCGLQVTVDQVYSVYEDPASKNSFTVFRASASADNTAELGQYVPIADLAVMSFPDTAQRIMMQRYAAEHSNRGFGLYIGDAASGEVHPPDNGKSSL